MNVLSTSPARVGWSVRLRVLAGSAAVAAALSACGAESANDAESADVTMGASDASSTAAPFGKWTRGDSGVEGDGALLQGHLVLDEGCLYVGDSPESRAFVVLPDDATWDGETQTVTLDGERVRVGDDVAIGGGEIGDASLIASTPANCDATRAFQGFRVGPAL